MNSILRFPFLLLILSISSTIIAQGFDLGRVVMRDGSVEHVNIKFNCAWVSFFSQRTSTVVLKRKGLNDKFGPDKVKEFEFNGRRFVVLENFKTLKINGKFKADFVEVFAQGAINLYMHYAMVDMGEVRYTTSRFVICNNDKSKRLGIYNYKKQLNEIAAFFEKSPYIKQKVLKSNLNEEDLLAFVRKYNSEH